MNVTEFLQIAGVPIYRDDKGAVCFKAGFAINADGSPHAYAPAGMPALDYLANAGSPGNWWGIATDSKGTPYLQAAWHPAPGFYVSTTALIDSAFAADHPSRYLDSERYAFAVIPGGTYFAKLGDVGLAYNQLSGDNMYFALGDVGPKTKIGEGSMLLARCLGLSWDPKNGGTAKRIINYVILPGSDPGYSPWELKCKKAIELVDAWGGLVRLKSLSKLLA